MWTDGTDGGVVRVPGMRNGDVLTTRVRHGLGAVHIRQTFRELNRANLATRLHITPWLGRHRVDKLRPQHISDCYRELGRSLSPSSIRRVHAVLRRALTVAVRWGLAPTNPALMVDPPSLKRRDLRPYTVEEARKLLDAVSGDRLEARWVIAIMLGLRQGEALGLMWRDIEFEARTLHVRRSLQRQPDGTLALVDTKTQRSNRLLPMPPAVAAALVRRRQAQHAELERVGHPDNAGGLISTTAMEPRSTLGTTTGHLYASRATPDSDRSGCTTCDTRPPPSCLSKG
jgi:integrase